MTIEIPSAPKDMDSEQLAKCLEVGADYKLYASLPFVARLHGIDMEDWFRASADRIRTLRAEVERLRHALAEARLLLRVQRPHAALEWIDAALRGGDHE